MSEWTKEQWLEGWRKLQYGQMGQPLNKPRLDTLEKIKAQIPALREELNDEQKLAQVYKFAFNFYKDPESSSKNLGGVYFRTCLTVKDLETAKEAVNLLLNNRRHIDKLQKYLAQVN